MRKQIFFVKKTNPKWKKKKKREKNFECLSTFGLLEREREEDEVNREKLSFEDFFNGDVKFICDDLSS